MTAASRPMEFPIMKARPSDFLVYESIALPPVAEAGPFRYMRLRKCGYTTFEAVGAVAEFHGATRADVGYAGLKDEDGITEQTLSLPAAVADQADAFNEAFAGSPQRFLALSPTGCGDHPLEIGELEGNSFRIVLRGIGPELAESFADLPRRCPLFFVNYYDTQRFGVPGGPKENHLIGGALLRGDLAAAFAVMCRSPSPEGVAATQHDGPPERFFTQLDPRLLSFYLSAFSSAEWNSRIRTSLASLGREEDVSEVHRDGIHYTFALRQQLVLNLLAHQPSVPQRKLRWTDGGISESVSQRSTVTQTQVRVHAVSEDAERPGSHTCEVSFFLASGCYATSAVAQLAAQLAASPPAATPS